MSKETKTNIDKKQEQQRTKIAKKTFLDALEAALGVAQTAAKKTGLSRTQHYKWMKEDPEYKERVEEIADIALDFAESQLHKQMSQGSTTATIFYLKTKGKKRGYVERIEHEEVGSREPIQVEIIDPSEQNETESDR